MLACLVRLLRQQFCGERLREIGTAVGPTAFPTAETARSESLIDRTSGSAPPLLIRLTYLEPLRRLLPLVFDGKPVQISVTYPKDTYPGRRGGAAPRRPP